VFCCLPARRTRLWQVGVARNRLHEKLLYNISEKHHYIMKAFTITRLLIALVATSFLFSCQSDTAISDDSLVYISEDAAMVTALQPRQLMEKADFEALKQTEGYQQLIEEAGQSSSVLADVVANPEKSGVNLDKNIYFAMESTATKEQYAVITMSLSDPTAFEALVKAADVEIIPAKQTNNYAFPDKNSGLAWNSEIAIIGFSDDATDLKAILEASLDTPAKSSVAANRHLKKSLSKEYDIINWFSSDALLNYEEVSNGAKLLNYDAEDIKGNYIAHYLTFGKGKISSEAVLDISGKIAKDLGMLFKDKVKTDFLSAAPGGNPLFLLSAAFDFKGLNQLLIEKYSKGLASMEMDKYGLSSDELLEALQGDIMLMAYPVENDDPSLFFMAKIDDLNAINKLIEVGEKEEMLKALPSGIYQLIDGKQDSMNAQYNEDETAYLMVKDDMLYLSASSDLIEKVQKGTLGIDGAIASKGASIINQHIFTALGNPIVIEELKEEFNGIKSVEASANRKGTRLEILMENEKENSLKYIIEQMQAAEKEEEASEL
jgi:hypothetical protein